MTKSIGANLAAQFATAHEASSNSRKETNMDLWNNNVGREIARKNPKASEAKLSNLVYQALRNRKLKTKPF